uniref:Beta-lactamase domain-containing protein n=1 Tax=Angiostrongylus cantonensis TaxID=6313 RepID=A0A0K0DE40_ANGCA
MTIMLLAWSLMTTLSLLLVVFSTLQYSFAVLLRQYSLADLWQRRVLNAVHLLPTHTSTVYPTFAGVSSGTGSTRVHMTVDDVQEFIDRANDTEITSICCYGYLGQFFYVVNTDLASEDEVKVFLNLTMNDLETVAEEMLMRQMKPGHICRGGDGLFQAVWRGSRRALRHFVVQEGDIHTVFRQDEIQGRHGYYPTTLQMTSEVNHCRSLMVWEKGYGVKYRIQTGFNLMEMEAEMLNQQMKPFQIASLSGFYYVIWHSDEFSWVRRSIPRTALCESTSINSTILDLAVEEQMRSFEIPSLSFCIYKGGKSLLAVSYGYSDIRKETDETPCHTSIEVFVPIVESDLVISSGILSSIDVSRSHPWLRAITIRNLLEHSSGGWQNTEKLEFNRAPQSKNLNESALLQHYIRSYKPKFQPGTRYLYSNIGYIILGKIIAQVRDIYVSYYSPDNANPYTYWTPSKLNAAAGWVMSAKEVARLFMLLEERKHNWYRLLVLPSTANRNYGRGVQLGNDGSLYHLGSLAGSEGIGYTKGDLQVSILTNFRGREQGQQTPWMHRLCQMLAENIITL